MRRLVIIAVLVVLAACSGDTTAATPHPGTLTVQLGNVGSNDGAMILLVSGGPVTTVTPAAGDQLTSMTDAAGTHIMVTGALASGTVATLAVPDINAVAAYVVSVIQVADATTYGLRDVAGYTAQVSRGP